MSKTRKTVIMPTEIDHVAKSFVALGLHDGKQVPCSNLSCTENCYMCKGTGYVEIRVPVSWENIKKIYAHAVHMFGYNPPCEKDEHEEDAQMDIEFLAGYEAFSEFRTIDAVNEHNPYISEQWQAGWEKALEHKLQEFNIKEREQCQVKNG